MSILVINSFLNLNRPKKIKSQKEKIFSGMNLENVPKNFFNYQHEETVEQLWNILKSKAKTIEDIE